MKLLLHACCGPCLCYPAEKLAADGRQFDVLFFNPNIHPYREFKHRLSTLRELCEQKRYHLFIAKDYPLENCLRGMLAEPVTRCAWCYRTRLRYAARFARENGYDAFSTTLLVSPYQKHELIVQCAQAAAQEFAIPFYYEDFRTGYQRGVELSLELGLYRQPYCGCVFSERDRFLPHSKTATAALTRVSKCITMVNGSAPIGAAGGGEQGEAGC